MSATASMSPAQASAAMAAEMAALATTPAGPPPPGVIPNLMDATSHEGAIIGVGVTMMVLTTFFVGLRLYSSYRVTRSAGAEDIICVCATIFSFAYSAFTFHLAYYSRHMWNLPALWMLAEDYWKLRFAQNTLQAFAFFFSRLPIFLLYLRLFGRNFGFRVAVFIGIGVTFAIYFSEIPLIAYFCAPRDGELWTSPEVSANCIKLTWYAIVQGACNIAADLYILLLPIPVIMGLHLTTKKKLGVLAIFAVGAIAFICSVISLYFRYELTFGSDLNWNEGAFIASGTVEINIAIICCSIPACASLLKHMNQDKSFFASLRSLFTSRGATSKMTKGTTDSTEPSFGSGMGHSKPSMIGPYNTRNGDGWMELEQKPGYVTSQRNGGIKRTVEVEVV